MSDRVLEVTKTGEEVSIGNGECDYGIGLRHFVGVFGYEPPEGCSPLMITIAQEAPPGGDFGEPLTLERHYSGWQLISSKPSNACQEWAKRNPEKAAKGFSKYLPTVCEVRAAYNGSGSEFGTHQLIDAQELERYARRIHACYNALAGIDDPAKAIPALVTACEHLHYYVTHPGECSDDQLGPWFREARAALALFPKRE